MSRHVEAELCITTGLLLTGVLILVVIELCLPTLDLATVS